MRTTTSSAMMTIMMAVSAGACSASTAAADVNNGERAEETRSVSGFEAIRAEGVYRLDISESAAFRVVVSGDSYNVPRIETRVEGGTLVISQSSSISSDIPTVVTVQMPNLESASIGGVIAAHVSGFAGSALRLEQRGTSSMSVEDAQYTQLSVGVAGTSSLQLAGHADRLTLHVSGTSQATAKSFTAEVAEVVISGTSVVTLGECGTLTGSVDGISVLNYLGTPDSARGVRMALTSSLRFVGR